MKIEKYKARGEIRYRFRAYVGLDTSGKPIRIQQSGFETKKEAQLAYAEAVTSIVPTRNKNITVQQLYNIWIESYKIGVKESTLQHTEQIFRDHILPEFAQLKVIELTPIQLQRFANRTVSERVNGKRTFTYLKKLLAFAWKQGVIDQNPADRVDIPKASKGPHKPENLNVYTKDELHTFLSLAQERLSPMWYAFFRLLSYTGMRRGEALALKWSDLYEGACTISITKTVTRGSNGIYVSDTPKTDRSTRTILLDPETLDILTALPHDCDLIFHNTKMELITLSQPIRQAHKVVDGTDLKYISPHGFRHTHCSLLFSAGVSIPEVQDRLGHSDVKTTIDIYNHVYEADKTKALNRFIDFMEA